MRTEQGFTLIELLITLVILSILVALAIPNFRELMDRNATTAVANDMLSSILLARSESIKREQPVIFSGNGDLTAWQVAADTNGDNTGDDVLLQHTLGGNGIDVSAVGGNTITFNTRGRTTSDATNNSFTITKNSATRHVCFSAIGRPRVQKGACQ